MRTYVATAVAALLAATFVSGVSAAIAGGDAAAALTRGVSMLLRFWWWSIPTGIGLGLVLWAIATRYRPRAAALLGAATAIPFAVTLVAALLLDDSLRRRIQPVWIQLDGERFLPPDRLTIAAAGILWGLLVGTPLFAAAAGILSRRSHRAA